MFGVLESVFMGIWEQDLTALNTVSSTFFIYLMIAAFIGLESAFLPATPLPCDSVVVLAGSLVAIGIVDGATMFSLLVMAASLGSCLAFYQGKMLIKHPVGERWISKIPADKQKMVDRLLAKNAFLAMFLARFMPVIRTLLPMGIGAFKKQPSSSTLAGAFPLISLSSAAMWVSVLMGCGYLVSLLPHAIGRFITMGLIAMPLISLAIAVLTGCVWLIRQSSSLECKQMKR